MAAERNIELVFPTDGLDRRWGYQRQPPFTTTDCCNVRPYGALEKRYRGGSRPGLSRAYPSAIGGGNPVRMLAAVRQAGWHTGGTWVDEFNGSEMDSEIWTPQQTGSGHQSASLPDVSAGCAWSPAITIKTAIRSSIETEGDVDTWIIWMLIHSDVATHPHQYHLWSRMNDASPDVRTDGWEVSIDVYHVAGIGYFSVISRQYVDGVMEQDVTFANPPWASGSAFHNFMVVIDNLNSKGRIYYDGIPIHNPVVYPSGYALQTGDNGGDRMGFAFEPNGADQCCAAMFGVRYIGESAGETNRLRLMASANGALYQESESEDLEQVSITPLTLASDRTIQATQSAGKLYIGDNGDVSIDGTDGTIGGGGDDELTATATPAWTQYCDADGNYIVSITEGTGDVVNGTYSVSAVDDTKITLAAAPGAGTCSYRIEPAPKVYDAGTETLAEWTATTGFMPAGCPLICRYRGRLVLAGGATAPHVWYMSRSGDPRDFDYAETDMAAPYAGTSTLAAVIAEPLTALVPHKDDYLVMACRNSLWVLRGDLRSGGQIGNVSRAVGIVGANAWCWTPAGELVFLSTAGLYVLLAGGMMEPKSISAERLPDELNNPSDDDVVSLAFDAIENAVHIYVTNTAARKATGASYVHYWLDWKSVRPHPTIPNALLAAFFPLSLNDDHEPHAVVEFESPDPHKGMVILGGNDGVVRRYDRDAVTDDGELLESHLFYGPVMLGPPGTIGTLAELVATLGTESDQVRWKVLIGESQEAVGDDTIIAPGWIMVDDDDAILVDDDTHLSLGYGAPSRVGEWDAGLNYIDHPRATGASMMLKVENPNLPLLSWTVEQIKAGISPAGRQRKT